MTGMRRQTIIDGCAARRVPPPPATAEPWVRLYSDGVHTVFDIDEPRARWRFGPHGGLINFVIYEEDDFKSERSKAPRPEKCWRPMAPGPERDAEIARIPT